MRSLLSEKGFGGADVELLCECVDLLDVKAGDYLIRAGTPWTHVHLLLTGTIQYDAWAYSVNRPQPHLTSLHFTSRHVTRLHFTSHSRRRVGAWSEQRGWERSTWLDLAWPGLAWRGR